MFIRMKIVRRLLLRKIMMIFEFHLISIQQHFIRPKNLYSCVRASWFWYFHSRNTFHKRWSKVYKIQQQCRWKWMEKLILKLFSKTIMNHLVQMKWQQNVKENSFVIRIISYTSKEENSNHFTSIQKMWKSFFLYFFYFVFFEK